MGRLLRALAGPHRRRGLRAGVRRPGSHRQQRGCEPGAGRRDRARPAAWLAGRGRARARRRPRYGGSGGSRRRGGASRDRGSGPGEPAGRERAPGRGGARRRHARAAGGSPAGGARRARADGRDSQAARRRASRGARPGSAATSARAGRRDARDRRGAFTGLRARMWIGGGGDRSSRLRGRVDTGVHRSDPTRDRGVGERVPRSILPSARGRTASRAPDRHARRERCRRDP